jgi:DNA polymerase sigma
MHVLQTWVSCRLWGTLDRRYAALYRLVKAWAAAHGVNDAASNTLNSWSWGLMVAFYLQVCACYKTVTFLGFLLSFLLSCGVQV